MHCLLSLALNTMDDDAFGFEGDDQNPFGEGELDFDNEDFGDFGDDDLDFGNTDFPIDDEEQKVRGKVIFTHYCCSEGDSGVKNSHAIAQIFLGGQKRL